MPEALRATYRLQLRNGVGFADAAALAPYLALLGVSHLYLSPPFTARAGSTHGYDVADPTALDPALGGDDGFREMAAALHAHGLGLILDIVPNHVAADTANPWWRSVLTWGEHSPFARFFDIDWAAHAGGTPGTLTLPILGAPLDEVVSAGDLRVRLDAAAGRFGLAYFEHHLPLAPASWPAIAPLPGDLAAALRRAAPADLPGLERELATRLGEDDALRRAVAAACDLPSGRLREVLDAQPYRLAFWRDAAATLNMRRFFDINELAGLRVEDPHVFDASHDLVLRLVRVGLVDGVRVDHVDGLADPAEYLRRLAHGLAPRDPRPPVLVEKILGPDETLPADWAVDGTTGYEFLVDLGGLFVDPSGRDGIDAAFRRFGGDPDGFETTVRAARAEILGTLFAAELTRLAHRARRLLAKTSPDADAASLRTALAALIVGFDVYRTYGDRDGWSEADRRRLADAFAHATASTADDPAARAALAALRRLLLERGPAGHDVRSLVVALQQLTGPVAAKAVEDTAFYRWNRLVSLNEVGGEPDRFGTTPEAFHAVCAGRAADWPRALLATATHDTKRGEDTRLRISALSEMAADWAETVAAWAEGNAPLRTGTGGGPAPAPEAELLFYQSLVGAWPPGLDPADAPALEALAARLAAYMEKAAREAKTRTRWTDPDAAYEEGLAAFVRACLDPARSRAFLASVDALVCRIAPAAALHGLSQSLIKIAAPGVPDIYQGTEGWDHSLVDPDNRRPVPFDALATQLAALPEPGAAGPLVDAWRDGRVKQWTIALALRVRHGHAGAFVGGAYTALPVEGDQAGRALAFARGTPETGMAVAVAPRLALPLLDGVDRPLVPAERWGDTAVALPDGLADAALRDAFTGAIHSGGRLLLGDLLAGFPVALLVAAG